MLLLKYIPDSYYIEQIKRMYELLDRKPMHIHIFIDDNNPQRLINKYTKTVNIPSISYSIAHEKTTAHGTIDMARNNMVIYPKRLHGMEIK